MKVMILNVERAQEPAEYTVSMEVGGREVSFDFKVTLPEMTGASTADLDFYYLFQGRGVGPKIAKIVLALYRGEEVAFPVDLGEVVTNAKIR